MKCYFCEIEEREHWGGYWCKGCRQIKNLGNVYGFERILDLLKKCCIRDENQLEKKIDNHKQQNTDLSYYDNPKSNTRLTRSKATTD